MHIPQLLSPPEIAELRSAAEAAITAEQNGTMAEQAGILATVDGGNTTTSCENGHCIPGSA
ncbi:MAG: hypothetical protein K2X97_07275 [Mycobacteriaceae bacterium]|nr:hypothetical protein [Mycobacteriaceae bacterium]